jgi:hypothetical protein
MGSVRSRTECDTGIRRGVADSRRKAVLVDPGRESVDGVTLVRRRAAGKSGAPENRCGELRKQDGSDPRAAIAAALALVVEWWLSLLIVFLALVLSVAILGAAANGLIRKAGSLKPEQALEEATLTKDALKELRAG